ncbi:3-oxoacyl-ACP synthase III family protein [Kitasatospora mediocidica]|uniref:3-oxoacyl-ACP synthase III family protein n=1 Tax=Kitasatospora mediocidica TaxID=58352 RepID=UPI0007C69C6F|nr:beta-ketoacyl-ACP synthase 3 [Kitasatospora mediocidica]
MNTLNSSPHPHPIGIIATGSYLPEQIIHNDHIAALAGVTDEWIKRKTGIHQRHRAAPHEATSDLAAQAARSALQQAGLHPTDLAYIVVATSTPDHPQPATASIVQHLLHATNAAAFDINTVCSGFVYALTVMERLLHNQPQHRYGLVIGADIYSRILDYADPKTAILFGDGAGAAILGPVPHHQGLLKTTLTTHGNQHDLISVPAGGSRHPATADTVESGRHYFHMDGRAVADFVQTHLPQAIHSLLSTTGTSPHQITHLIPHQANATLLGKVWPQLNLPHTTLHLTLKHHANTGAASIPITLDTINRANQLHDNDTLILAAFGGGMNTGTTLLRWTPTHAATHAVDHTPVGVGAEAEPLRV